MANIKIKKSAFWQFFQQFGPLSYFFTLVSSNFVAFVSLCWGSINFLLLLIWFLSMTYKFCHIFILKQTKINTFFLKMICIDYFYFFLKIIFGSSIKQTICLFIWYYLVVVVNGITCNFHYYIKIVFFHQFFFNFTNTNHFFIIK